MLQKVGKEMSPWMCLWGNGSREDEDWDEEDAKSEDRFGGAVRDISVQRYPLRAKSWAMASPMPRVPPVIRACGAVGGMGDIPLVVWSASVFEKRMSDVYVNGLMIGDTSNVGTTWDGTWENIDDVIKAFARACQRDRAIDFPVRSPRFTPPAHNESLSSTLNALFVFESASACLSTSNRYVR